jgi:hypothetical protein
MMGDRKNYSLTYPTAEYAPFCLIRQHGIHFLPNTESGGIKQFSQLYAKS